eukprot:384778-Heterocapsa_arctica.AAC.1
MAVSAASENTPMGSPRFSGSCPATVTPRYGLPKTTECDPYTESMTAFVHSCVPSLRTKTVFTLHRHEASVLISSLLQVGWEMFEKRRFMKFAGSPVT